MKTRIPSGAGAAWLVALSTGVCSAQIDAERLTIETADGLARGWVATVELDHPSVRAAVGVAHANESETHPYRLVSTETWATESDITLAVNANFFGAAPDGSASIVGLCVSDGAVVSGPRVYDDTPDPALIILADGTARIDRIGDNKLGDVRYAVAGVGGSESAVVPGTALINKGQNLGETARVQPAARHPRTAAGVSRDGRVLTLVVIDGRQDDWSVGVTLPELGDLLLERGVWDAVNLDGGGSSSFIYRTPGGTKKNQPSDGVFRPVAVSLGFRLVERVSGSQPDGE